MTDGIRGQVDGAALAAGIGVDGEEVAWRKSFTGFDEAEESQHQAGRIEVMVERIRADTGGTVDYLESTGSAIDEGADRVDDAVPRPTDVLTAVREPVAGIEEVSVGTDERAGQTEVVATMHESAFEASSEVSREVERIATASEEQAARVEETGGSVERLVGGDGRE